MTDRAIIWTAVSAQHQADDDKTSLPEQEAAARALADQHGWYVAEVLTVPGHSRRYIDFHDLNRDALAAGIKAFARLMQHWEAADFDIMIVRDSSRFARSQALHAYIVERTITTGARIYSLSDGWIDEQNYRMWIAMGGYSAATYVDHLAKAQRAAKDNLASRGLPHNGRPPWFMHVERDEYGKALSMQTNRDHARLYDDLAALILAGVSWRHIERELWDQFGHGKNGKRWPRYAMYHAVLNPYWWGNSARAWNEASLPNGQSKDLWAFDEDAPLPAGVRIWRSTHDPVWDGERAEAIKSELRRRRQSLRGSALASRSHKFTGLLLCGFCGRNIVFDGQGNYCCRSKYTARTEPRCERTHCLSETKIIAYVNTLLQRVIDLADPAEIIRDLHGEDTSTDRIEQIETEIAQVQDQSRRLIVKQATAPDALSSLYDEQLQSLGSQLTTLEANLSAARQQAPIHSPSNIEQALTEIQSHTSLEAFWTSDDTKINQVLHRLLGNRRLVIQDNQVTGTALAPR